MAVARIQVKLKPTVLDAQGAQVRHALQSLGFVSVATITAALIASMLVLPAFVLMREQTS